MEPLPEHNSTSWPFPFTAQDWEQTPAAVQAYLHTLRDEMGQLQERMENLEARLNQNATTSSRPPSSDSPYKKPRRRTGSSTSRRKGGGKPGHPGHCQVLLTIPPRSLPFGRSSTGYQHSGKENSRVLAQQVERAWLTTFIRKSPTRPRTMSWVEATQAPMAWRPWAGVMGGGSDASWQGGQSHDARSRSR